MDLQEETLKLAQELIQRPSITPLDEGCQAILSERLKKLGFEIQHLPFEKVHNLWATHTRSEGPRVVFAGHTDVVPPGELSKWNFPPFEPTIFKGSLYGRGAADMKGSLAAMVTAVERFLHTHPDYKGSIGFLLTSDEEGEAQHGTLKVVEYLKNIHYQIDYCIVGEPTASKTVGDTLKIGRRGSLNGTLTVIGKQGHVAYPEKAHNPIHLAFKPLTELCMEKWDTGNEAFPPTSFQIANIEAGTGATNVIPGILKCQFNLRFNTENTPERLIQRITSILKKHDLEYQLDYTVSALPFLTKPGHLINAAIQAIESTQNLTPLLSTSGGTSDARFIAPLGVEVIEIGPSNETIHSANECISLEALRSLSKLYEQLLVSLLK